MDRAKALTGNEFGAQDYSAVKEESETSQKCIGLYRNNPGKLHGNADCSPDEWSLC